MVKARGEFTVAPLSDGSDGRGVVSVTTYFLATNLSTGVTTKTSGWGTALQPLTPTKKYLWEYSVTAYDSGAPTTTAPVIKGVYGDKGDDGVSVTSMTEEYYHSTSSTTQTGGAWSTTVPAWVDGKYLWLRIKTVYSNSTVTYTKAMNVTGQKGEVGSQGKDKFLWIKYADDDKGTGMSDSGVGKKYIGVSPNQLTAKESDNPLDYKWSPMYDLGALDDISLADKTEILSGTEIFTDKADDANVHVEIDGKSVQNAGSGKNLLPHLDNWESFKGATIVDGVATIPLKGLITVRYKWDSTTSPQFYGFEILEGDGRLVNTEYYDVNGIPIENTGGVHKGNGNAYRDLPLGSHSFSMPEISASTKEVVITINNHGDYSNKTLKIKSVYGYSGENKPYEPPAPTPDYPIAINSLNDVDIVSSVGKRNLFVDSKQILKMNNTTALYIPTHDIDELLNSVGEIASISFDIKLGDGGVERPVAVYYYQSSGLSLFIGTKHITPRKESRRYNFTGTVVNNPVPQGYNKGSIIIYDSQRNHVEVTNVKISLGEESVYTLAPEDVPHDVYQDGVYKTNILLSEPLRSIGDVKDRLFRDTDGLWKVERNIQNIKLGKTTSLESSGASSYEGDLSTNRYLYLQEKPVGGGVGKYELCSHLPHKDMVWTDQSYLKGTSVNSNQFHIRIPNDTTGVIPTDGIRARNEKFQNYFDSQEKSGTPFVVQYMKREPIIETLPQADQTKLNNVQSFKNSNYIYTVDKSGIFKPELHATFKSKAWYRNFKTDTGVVDSQANKFKMTQQEKKVLDERYKELYAHSKLSGNIKTALYNAKVTYNTVFMALEISLHHYIMEKSETRLSELEAIYSGGNGYISAKTILEVALDNAQTNITEGIADDKTGRNRWIGKKYTWTDVNKIAPKLSHIRGLEPVENVVIDDTKRFTFDDDRYLAHFFTYLYSDKAKKISTTVAHDDGFTMMVNGQEIVSTANTITAPYVVSIPLSKGWNQVDMLLQEVGGGDYITLGHELSTLVDDMSCYLGGGFSASQIRQLSDEIDIRVQKGSVINAINVSTEGIRLEGEKVSIDGRTEFKDDVVMKSGVIQSADGGTKLDLNKNTFTFDKPFTIGSSQVATDKGVKDAVGNIQIGGRNLIIRNQEEKGKMVSPNSSIQPFHESSLMKGWIPVQSGEVLAFSQTRAVGNADGYFRFAYFRRQEISTDSLVRRKANNEDKFFETVPSEALWLKVSYNTTSVVKIERGNIVTDWTPAPEDVDSAISESQKSAEAVALAKANLAEINAKAHADGVLDKEEKARIAQAKANLDTAIAEAKKKADEAERLAKLHADTKVSQIQTITGGGKMFANPLSHSNSASSVKGYAVITTPIESPYMTKLEISGYNYYGSKSNIDLSVTFYAYTYFASSSFTNRGNFPIENVSLARDSEGRAVVILGMSTTTWSYPKINVKEAVVGHVTPPDSYANGWSLKYTDTLDGLNLTQITKVSGDDYKLGIEGAQSEAETARASADKAIKDANSAQSSANTANGLLSDLSNDSKLTPTEKKTVKKEWDVIVDERPKLLATATSSGVSSTAYVDMYNTLNTYITPLLASLGSTSNIVGVTFRARFRNYYSARQDLLNAITDKAKEYAEAQANKALADAKVDATAKANQAQKSAEAVALAKANLAEIQAKSYADGIVTAEENARIAQAQANLDKALAEAKAKADEAERLAKLHADSEIGKLPTWENDYRVRTANPLPISKKDGSPLDEFSSYEVVGKVTGTGTDTYAYAIFRAKATSGATAMGWELEKVAENGTGSNHVEFFLDENGTPSVRLYAHGSYYNVRVNHTEYIGGDTPYLRAQKSSEAVAIAKANLAEANAKAHADGKVTNEERARIAQAEANLKSAMAEAKKKADEAERLAKLHADTKANDALAQAKIDATTKANEAKKSAENLAIAKANLAEVNAKAHADGKVTAEEKARIAQAQTNLNIAVSEAKSKADEAQRLAKAYAELQVESIEVGGRNLLPNTDETTEYKNKATVRAEYLRTDYDFAPIFDSHGLIEYTISFDLKSEKNGFINVYMQNGSGAKYGFSKSVNATTEWSRHSFSFVPYVSNTSMVNSYLAFFGTYDTGRVPTVRALKLEKGNKATDWTPAPEDVDIKIDDKADKETTEDLQQSLDSLNQVVGEIGIDGIREQLLEYQKLLASVNKDTKIANSRLEQILSDHETGEITRINNILGKLTDKWITQEGFININGDETELSIHKGDVSMVLGSAGLVFYSGGEAVATITNQYMRIDRGIFAESIHVGRHQWSPLKRNKDHLLLNFVGDPLI